MSLPTKADCKRAHRAMMEEAKRLAKIPSQPPRWHPLDADQFDIEREAEQQGISTAKYLRGW